MFKGKKKLKQPVQPKQPKQERVKQPKYGFAEFSDELKNLKLADYGEWSPQFKKISLFFIGLIGFLLGALVLMYPMLSQYDQLQAQKVELLDTYKKKKTDLTRDEYFQSQLGELNRVFNALLSQLPKEAELPALVDGVAVSARSSNLRINDLHLDAEDKTNIIIKQPITITAMGDFHSFGRVAFDISKMERIVTIDDFTAYVNPEINKQKEIAPIVTFNIKANTYRYDEKNNMATGAVQ